MSQNNHIKHFQRFTARLALYSFYWLFSKLPYNVVTWIAHIMINIGFKFTIRQRKLARDSLKIAFGKEKDSGEIDAILEKCFKNLGLGMTEVIYYLSHPMIISQKILLEGKEYLDEAITKGKGIVAVTAHFGNFPLMMMYFAQSGYATNALIRSARDQKLEQFLFEKRKNFGLNTIYAVPRRQCITNSLKVLRNNEILFVPLDQNFGSGRGVFVEFFGQKAATATGPVVFATRTKASILPMFIVRQNADTHKIIIEPPIDMEERNNDQENILANTTKITNLIEKYIRRYPHEWGWMHRRWKSRPYQTKYLPNA